MNRSILICFVVLFSASVWADTDEAIQKRIFEQYRLQAENGDANAQFIIASRYESGKGVEKNTERAHYWYEMAAKKGHPLAKIKVDESAEANASSAAKANPPVKQATRAPDTVKPKEPPAPPAPPAKAPETKPVAAKMAAREPAVSNINLAQTVLGGKWNRAQKPVEFLPSPLATCLSTNPTEIVCFSQELTRNVADKGLTYTVKATLKGMDSHEGRFSLHYIYNVIDVDGKPFAKTSSTQADFGDIAARSGWQEPGQQLECRLRDEHTMNCLRSDQKTSYAFIRE